MAALGLILLGGIFIIGTAVLIGTVIGAAFLTAWAYRRFVRPEIRRETTLYYDRATWDHPQRGDRSR